MEQVTGAATEALKTLVREGAIVFGLLAYLFWSNWRLSLVLLLVAPPVVLVVRKASKRFRKLSHRIQNSMGDVSHIVNEAINGFAVVKSYGGADFERERFEQASRENLRQSMKMVVTTSLNTPLVQLLMAVAMSFVVYMALQPDILGDVSAGEFVAYITAAGLLSKPVRSLTDVNEKIQRGIAAPSPCLSFWTRRVKPIAASLTPAVAVANWNSGTSALPTRTASRCSRTSACMSNLARPWPWWGAPVPEKHAGQPVAAFLRMRAGADPAGRSALAGIPVVGSPQPDCHGQPEGCLV